MRLFLRTLSDVLIWPFAGGAFSDTPIADKANIGFVNNALNGNLNALASESYGLRLQQTLRLRFLRGAAIRAGDGVSLPGENAPAWRCVEVDAYPFVTVARLERIAG